MSFNDEEKQIDAKLSAAWAQHRPAIIVVLALLLVSLVMCSRAHAGTAGGNVIDNDTIGQIVLTTAINGIQYDFCEVLPVSIAGHVGIDTVNLKGEGFDVKVKNGDRIEEGTPLVTFDRSVIEKAGYPLVTPVIVLNADAFDTVDPVKLGPVSHGDPLLDVQKKA